MDKQQRKRRAVIGAISLLEWRDRMAREDARDRMAREKADREMMMRYELMVAEMRKQAEEFWKPRAEQQRHWRSLVVRENISPVSNASHYS